MKTKTFYTTGEIARMLDMSSATIFRAVDAKKLRASTTPGGHYRVAREDLKSFLKASGISRDVLGEESKTVLIVEDNPVEQRAYRRALSKENGLNVECTDSGFQAGYLTKSLMPGLIILDVFLKDGDGRDVAAMIRKDPELSDTKILVITAMDDEGTLRNLRASGVAGVLRKPVAPEVLRKKALELIRG